MEELNKKYKNNNNLAMLYDFQVVHNLKILSKTNLKIFNIYEQACRNFAKQRLVLSLHNYNMDHMSLNDKLTKRDIISKILEGNVRDIIEDKTMSKKQISIFIGNIMPKLVNNSQIELVVDNFKKI